MAIKNSSAESSLDKARGTLVFLVAVWVCFIPMLPALISLGGLALTGLTIVAYKHPDAYEKIYVALGVALGVGFVLYIVITTTYSSGRSSAIVEMLKLNPNGLMKTPEMKLTADWTPGVLLLIYLYVTFLRAFPQLGIISKKN